MAVAAHKLLGWVRKGITKALLFVKDSNYNLSKKASLALASIYEPVLFKKSTNEPIFSTITLNQEKMMKFPQSAFILFLELFIHKGLCHFNQLRINFEAINASFN